MQLRLPDNPDYTKGPVPLKTLKEEDGWLGLVDTWETSFPQIVPLRDYKGYSKNMVWLPNEEVARIWQAFASENPKTIIHLPMFEGHNTYGSPDPNGWHNSFLAAHEPFEVVASGPLGPDLGVEYFAGTRKLKASKMYNNNPYRVTLQGLPPGLHGIYAVTTVNGAKEISRPATIMFQSRR